MTRPGYDEVLELLKRGAVVEAQEIFNALHESALTHSRASAQQLERIHPSGTGHGQQLESDGMVCWLVENGKKSGPFCLHCHNKESKLVRLLALDGATYACLACKTQYARNLCG